MALETLECSQDPFCYVGIVNNMGFNLDFASSSAKKNAMKYWEFPDSSPEACTDDHFLGEESPPVITQLTTVAGRGKRRRTKTSKNKEELESQRITHIEVERNRRKQMNEYLTVIRSLMPDSYVQRCDQSSIIGGAINFVKELEQLLQTLEAQKRTISQQSPNHGCSPSLFTDFFSFPQYRIKSSLQAADNLPAADIEVTLAERHANLKILSKRRHRQLLKLVTGLQCLHLSVLHLNVTTVDQMVLYSLIVKIEDECQLTTVDEIADAVNQLIGRVEEEGSF